MDTIQFHIRFICDNMQDKHPQLTQAQMGLQEILKSTYASSENVKGSIG